MAANHFSGARQEPEPPYRYDLVRALFIAMFNSRNACAQARAKLITDDLRPSDSAIFEAIVATTSEGAIPDEYAVIQWLKDHERLHEVHRGDLAVSQLATADPGPDFQLKVDGWVRGILEDAESRAQIDLGDALRYLGYFPNRAEYRAAVEAKQKCLADIQRRLKGSAGKESDDKATSYFPIMTDSETEDLQPGRGIIGDVLFEDSIAYLFGDSDTWKTFIAISMALCIATGVAWLGRAVIQGIVVYVVAEGARGIGVRIHAWKLLHGIDESTELFVVPVPVNLLDPDAIPRLILSIRAHPRIGDRGPILVIFDTLARSMDGGDENNTRDANQVTSAAGMLKATFGCCVLVVHHSGVAGGKGRMRGNSAYRGNSDTVIKVIAPVLAEGVKRKPGDTVTLHSVKAKEVGGFEDINVTTVLRTWADEETSAIKSSLVIVATDAKAQTWERPFTKNQLAALTALSAASEPIATTAWEVATAIPKRSFLDAIAALREHSYVTVIESGRNRFYSITDSGRTRLRAKVQDECEIGATAPIDEMGEHAIGAKEVLAPIHPEVPANPEIFRDEIGAKVGDTLYPLAPSHLSSAEIVDEVVDEDVHITIVLPREEGNVVDDDIRDEADMYIDHLNSVLARLTPQAWGCRYPTHQPSWYAYSDGVTLSCDICHPRPSSLGA